MHMKHDLARSFSASAAALLMLALAACGSAKANLTPTVSVEEIFTSAAQTFDAQQATELALTPPTETPAPSPFPTLAPQPTLGPVATISFGAPTVASGGAPGCDNAAYVADVTIPDGTKMTPNQDFNKTWTLFNNGTCTWDNTYQLAFVNGDKLNGSNIHVAVPVAPGTQINLTIPMQAPQNYGDYKGTWQMQNSQGQFFGSQITVLVKVRTADLPDTATATP